MSSMSTMQEALQVAKQVLAAYDKHDRPVTVLDTESKTHYVLIKGTTAMRDMLTDVERELVWLGDPEPRHFRAHRGFRAVAADAVAVVQSRVLPEERLVIGGHSLGGAVAVLVAWHLASLGHKNITVYTYGSPRVLSTKAARHYNNLVPDTIRVLHDRDLIPRVPVWGYRHVGRTLHIKSNGAKVLPIKRGWRTVLDWLGFRPGDLTDHVMAHYVEALENRVWKGLKL